MILLLANSLLADTLSNALAIPLGLSLYALLRAIERPAAPTAVRVVGRRRGRHLRRR